MYQRRMREIRRKLHENIEKLKETLQECGGNICDDISLIEEMPLLYKKIQ